MSPTFAVRALLGTVLALAVPVVAAAQAEEPTPEGTEWHLVAYDDGGQELTDVPWDLAATLTLDAGQAYGSTGCNLFGATYEMGRQKEITFDRAGTNTDVGCEGRLHIETAYMAALPKTVRWSIDTGTTSERGLILFDADGRHILGFTSDGTARITRHVLELTELAEAQQAEIDRLRARIRNLERRVAAA